MASSKGAGKSACQMTKYIYSTLLLIFSIALIIGLIFSRQTRLSHDTHPAVALIVMLAAIVWLTMVEGGQGALVGLGPVNPELYKDSHKKTHTCTTIVHKGDNLDRYLLGRQFMVILIVFTVEYAGASHGGGHDLHLWGLPDWLINVMLVSGVAMILFTCMVGQLNSEINGCHCMLDYLNTWFAIITVWVALAIEFSGFLHTAYLVQRLVGWMAGKPIESNEPPRTLLQNLFFYLRCLISLAILGFSFAVTLVALFNGKTTMWDAVPPGASVVIFFVLMGVVGVLEGSQIAYFAVVKLQKSERENHGIFAKKTCEILFKNNNRNLASFIIGRQLCVVSCMFFIARITAVNVEIGTGENIFGVSDPIQNLMNTGLLGAMCVAIVGSISWRLIASAFPLQFLKNPIAYFFLRFCIFLEMTGLLHGAYVIAKIHKKIGWGRGFKRDEVYIGTAEERAAKEMQDDSGVIQPKPGHPIIPVQPAGSQEFDELDVYPENPPSEYEGPENDDLTDAKDTFDEEMSA